MFSKNFKLASILCIALFSVAAIFSSCGDDDEVMGCTDAEAENFDALAVVDDNTCIYARDKFLGDYLSSLNCPNDAVLMAISTDSLTFAISEGLDQADNSAVNVTFTSGVVSGLSFAAAISGMNLTIPETTLTGLPFDVGGVMLVLDITASGSFTISDDDLVGTIELLAAQASGATLGFDTCDVIGVKQ